MQLWIIILAFCPTLAVKTDIHVAALLPYSGALATGFACEVAYELALEDVEASNILPNHRIKLHIMDDECRPGLSVYLMHRLLFEEPTKLLLLGPVCSDCCVATAQAAVYWNITQTTNGCGTPVLSDHDMYPLFMRVNTVDLQANVLRIRAMKEYDWKKFAIIHTPHDLFDKVVTDLIQRASKENMTVLTSEILTGDYDFTLDRMERSEARIIFVFAYQTDGLKLLCAAHRKKLFGSRYVYILPGWWDAGLYNAIPEGVPCNVTAMHEVAHYALGVSAAFINPNQSTETRYGITPAEFNGRYDNFTKRGEGATLTNLNCYDVIWTIAYGVKNAMETMARDGWSRTLEDFTYEDTEMSQLLWDEMTNLSYTGVRGPVAFHPNGDVKGIFLFRQLLTREVTGADGGPTTHMFIQELAIYNPLAQEPFLITREPIWHGGRPPKDSIVLRTVILQVTLSVYVPLCIMAVLGLVSTVFFTAFNVYHRQKRFIKMSSPNLNNVALLGCGLMYLTVFFADLGPGSPQLVNCKLRSILASAGFSLAFGCLFTKTYRVHRIFLNKKLQRRVVKDSHLLAMVAVIVLLDAIIFVLWEAIDPRTITLKHDQTTAIDDDTVEVVKVTNCDSASSTYFVACLYGIKGILLIFGAFLSWETRKVNVPELNDSKNIGLCIYNAIVVSILAVGMGFALEDNPEITYLVSSLCTVFATTFTTCMIFVPKVMGIVSGKVGAEQLGEGNIGTITAPVAENSTGASTS